MREKKLASTLGSYALSTNSRDVTSREAWHLLGIMSEFVEATERLANIGPAASIFGPDRQSAAHAHHPGARAVLVAGCSAGSATSSPAKA